MVSVFDKHINPSDEAAPERHPLDEAIYDLHSSRRRVFPQHTNRASQAGFTCKRRLQWSRTKWDKAKLPPIDLQRRFTIGTGLEKQIIRDLEDAGIRIDQQQRDLSWSELQLTGHIDGKLPDFNAVLEIKTCSKFVFHRLQKAKSAGELLSFKEEYLRGYVVQAGLYALLMNLPKTVIHFYEKESGATYSLDVSLDDPKVLEAAEAALKRFQAVNEAIAGGVDLPAEPGDYCERCPFLTTCLPDVPKGEGLSLMDDAEIEELLNRREQLAEASSEYADVNDLLREKLAKPGIFLLGNWQVVVKETPWRETEIPEAVKLQFTKMGTRITRKYRKIG